MVITGTLDVTPLPEVLRQLAGERFTGELTLHTAAGLNRIYLRDGAPVSVEPAESGDLLGQVLVQARRLSEAAHRQSLATPPLPGQRYGDVLMALGLCDETLLKRALREQVRVRLLRLYPLRQGAYAAIPGEHRRGMQGNDSLGIPLPDPAEVPPPLQRGSRSLPSVEPGTAAKLVAERQSRQAPATSRPGIARPNSSNPGLAAGRPISSPGRPPSDPSGIRPAVPAARPPSDPSGIRAAAARPPSDSGVRSTAGGDAGAARPTGSRGLVSGRPITDATRGQQGIPPEEKAMLVLELEKRSKVIEKESLFSVLGVARQASADDIRQAATVLGKKYHPTRIGVLGLPHLQGPAEQMYRTIQKAYSTLGDPGRREAYEKELTAREGETAFREQQLEIDRVHATLYHARGQVYLRRRDYPSAAAELSEAARLDTTQGPYLGAAVWARFCAGQVAATDGLKELNKAMRMAQQNGRIRYYAGVLHRQADQLDRALWCFQKAKELDPSIEEVDGEIRLLMARGVRVAKDWQSWEKDIGKQPAQPKKGDDKGASAPGAAPAAPAAADKKGGLLSRLMNMEIGGSKK